MFLKDDCRVLHSVLGYVLAKCNKATNSDNTAKQRNLQRSTMFSEVHQPLHPETVFRQTAVLKALPDLFILFTI